MGEPTLSGNWLYTNGVCDAGRILHTPSSDEVSPDSLLNQPPSTTKCLNEVGERKTPPGPQLFLFILFKSESEGNRFFPPCKNPSSTHLHQFKCASVS